MTPKLLGALLMLGAALPAYADSLRCGLKVAQSGDSPYEVVAKCGEPVDRSIATVAETTTTCNTEGHGGVGQSVSTTRTVETWVYDFGPTTFIERVVFVDGRMTTATSGNRGAAGTAAAPPHGPTPGQQD